MRALYPPLTRVTLNAVSGAGKDYFVAILLTGRSDQLGTLMYFKLVLSNSIQTMWLCHLGGAYIRSYDIVVHVRPVTRRPVPVPQEDLKQNDAVPPKDDTNFLLSLR